MTKQVKIKRIYIADRYVVINFLKSRGLWDKGYYMLGDLFYYCKKDVAALDELVMPILAGYYNGDTGEKVEFGTVRCGGDHGMMTLTLVENTGTETTDVSYRVTGLCGGKSTRTGTIKSVSPGRITFIDSTSCKISISADGKTVSYTATLKSPSQESVSVRYVVKKESVITDASIDNLTASLRNNDVWVSYEIINHTNQRGIVVVKYYLEGRVPFVESYSIGANSIKRIERVIPIGGGVQPPSKLCLVLTDGTREIGEKVCVNVVGVCNTSCEASCQSECEASCQTGCEVTCQTDCESICQESCELSCQSECEASCENDCEKACQIGCEVSCQTACESTCQESCERTCQIGCEETIQQPTVCETACEQPPQTVIDRWACTLADFIGVSLEQARMIVIALIFVAVLLFIAALVR